jgi:predicted nucleic acid-binding protein
MTLAFVDANIPIYAAGRDHPLKRPCISVLHLIAEVPDAFVTSAEVLQEMMHHYVSRGHIQEGLAVVQDFALLMTGRTVSVAAEDVLSAYRMAVASSHPIPARDWLHAAVAKRLAATHIVSADRQFDYIPGLTRLDPRDYLSWQPLFTGDLPEQ